MFKVLSDKIHKVYNPNIYDGVGSANAPNDTAAEIGNPSVVSNMTNVILDFNTYVDSKLVNKRVNADSTVGLGDFP